ncbi:MAG: helix-turn-helix domain-containing protein [Aquamicrobium sp.]|uniref:helix-turn-helix domain-containing protein n=1 Tax=Aquamicrobium sp. TaxID=1872579 RepID=UPI00349E87ED|nr:helix-turn-helix domain-containing protein [Aquamicrobium sp.]
MQQSNFWGNLIHKLRIEQGVSQRVLADRAQVNRNTLRRIEAGKTSAEIATMERILRYLGYELEVMEEVSRDERLRRQAAIETNPDRRSKLAMSRILTMDLLATTGLIRLD